jgi:hypothetical protein
MTTDDMLKIVVNADVIEAIDGTCGQLSKFLSHKNIRYGNSAMQPQRIFSKATPDEQLLVRMDDKISRIRNTYEMRKNDIVDLMGYLVLYCVSRGWTDFEDLID